MAKRKIKVKTGPEAILEAKIKKKLELLGWLAIKITASLYLKGIPDLYATHPKYGQRWIEVKNINNYSFTPAQLKTFPQLCSHGAGVWILVNSSDSEISKLFKPPNWWTYVLNKM